MLKRIRIIAATVFFAGIALLFLDFTGTVHAWLGWMAKVQFLPALLALNLGVVAALLLLTLVFGRVYCSVVCPLGVMQDLVWVLSRKGKKRRWSQTYSPAVNWLRYGVLAVFVVALAAGVGSVVALLAPYSSFGRIAQNLFAPLYIWGNNALAYAAERLGSYAFYEKEVWLRSIPTFCIALATFVVLAVLAWRNGRTYCNTICPVGTILGAFARFSLLKPVIDTSKCNGCGLCGKGCKAACINSKEHTIDYSRCVACMDCIDTCNRGAISYTRRKTAAAAEGDPTDGGRRGFLGVLGALAIGTTAKAQEKLFDGGLAAIADKVPPKRSTAITPPGSRGARHFARHCTGCQLCVAACPNNVLRPSTAIESLMQPECSYERGYCRPECTRCSEVCPTGAIQKITSADRSAIQTGRAVWLEQNCVVTTDSVECGNCARHCPTAAITMVARQGASGKVPAVNTALCVGCGACENLCPARPFSAIYVEGNDVHQTI